MNERKPDRRPQIFERSYCELGVVAQPGRLVEIRAPDPDRPKGDWRRVWLTVSAAMWLRDWLPEAIETAKPEPDEGEA